MFDDGKGKCCKPNWSEKQAEGVWDYAAKFFATEASGTVSVFGCSKANKRIWWKTEGRMLKRNNKVTTLEFYSPQGHKLQDIPRGQFNENFDYECFNFVCTAGKYK